MFIAARPNTICCVCVFSVIQVKDSQEVINKLTPSIRIILENWINGPDQFQASPDRISLSENATIYGIRRYLRGSWLSLHTDHETTHVISAILQLDQVHQGCQMFCQKV